MTDLIIKKQVSRYEEAEYNLTRLLKYELINYSLDIMEHLIDPKNKLYIANSEIVQQHKNRLKEAYNLNDNDIKKINKEVKNIVNRVNKKNYFTSLLEWSRNNSLDCYNLINSYCYRLSKTLTSRINVKNELLYK